MEEALAYVLTDNEFSLVDAFTGAFYYMPCNDFSSLKILEVKDDSENERWIVKVSYDGIEEYWSIGYDWSFEALEGFNTFESDAGFDIEKINKRIQEKVSVRNPGLYKYIRIE